MTMEASKTVRKVAIIGGNRTPFARSNTLYSNATNQELQVAALQGLIDRYQLQGMRLGEFVSGAVIKHSRDFNLAREVLLSTTLSPYTPTYDVQQACATGLEAAASVANKIALGQIEVGIAGGSDTTSDAPIGINERLRHILLMANRQKTTKAKLKTLLKTRPSMLFKFALPRNGEPRTGLSMGDHCEDMAKRWNISRYDQDLLALTSHQRLAAAYEAGFFDDLLTPYLGLERDNNLRADSSLEKLSTLRPAYDKQHGTLTAGNSTPLTDGASMVLLASEDWAAKHNLPVLAYLRTVETAAVDFVSGEEGLLMAPVYAVPRMLKREGLGFGDFDFYEIHEAFAAQVLCTLKAWEDERYCQERLRWSGALGAIDPTKLNVNGSSLACGHPFAATGGRILATLAKLLNQQGSGRGLVSICAAGGQGITAILEK